MKKIGLISDTHSFIDQKLMDFLSHCDEIWHAGDIGNIQTADKLAEIAPLTAVYGNIDGADVRAVYPEYQYFSCEKVAVLMTHIGGYPKRYDPRAKYKIIQHRPKLFIAGHSHILKVIYDKNFELLHMNPGAAGKFGTHAKQTALRFAVNQHDITDLEVWEMPKQG